MISIAIPVYKAETCVARCIDSVLKQDWSDWELILVDDGSPDASGPICDEYAARDSRISVIHQKNGGVSRARNAGIDHARGEWIAFIDADDSLTPHALSILYGLSADTDLVCGAWKAGDELRHFLPQKVAREDIVGKVLTQHLNIGYPWGKLYRSDIIKTHNLKFPEGVRWAEDVMFVFSYLCHICNAVFTDKVVYLYDVSPGSAAGRLFSFDDELKGLLAMQRLKPSLVEIFSNDIDRYLGASSHLNRCVQAVLNDRSLSKACAMHKLKSLHFKRSELHWKDFSLKENVFAYLVSFRCWNLLWWLYHKN